MGSHRADHRGPIRRPSRTSKDPKYVGRRVAGRDSERVRAGRRSRPLLRSRAAAVERERPGRPRGSRPPRPSRRRIGPRQAQGGQARGIPRAAVQGPSLPAGAARPRFAGRRGRWTVTSTSADLADSMRPRYNAASAMTGEAGVGSVNLGERDPQVSRDSSRDALEDASDTELVKEAEQVAEQRDAALGSSPSSPRSRPTRSRRTAGCCRSIRPSSPPGSVSTACGRATTPAWTSTATTATRSSRSPTASSRSSATTASYGNKTSRHARGRHRDLVLPPVGVQRQRGRDRPSRRDHRRGRLHRPRDRLPPARRGPPRRRRPGRPLRRVRRPRRHAVGPHPWGASPVCDGGMFWFRWKKFSGSLTFFSAVSRASFAGE